jgi:predicted nucleic acid-binding protein
MRVLADTGVLYALLDTRDQYHTRAIEEAAQLEKERAELFIGYPTLLESYALVSRRLGTETARRWLREARRGLGTLNPRPDDYEAAEALVQHYADQRLSLFDATLAVLSERLGFAIWTFDADFDILRANVWRT